MKTSARLTVATLAMALMAAAGCGGGSDNSGASDDGSGGDQGSTGGKTGRTGGTGGKSSQNKGGSPGTGGDLGAGGSPGTGGSLATGGVAGTDAGLATGGSPGTGGTGLDGGVDAAAPMDMEAADAPGHDAPPPVLPPMPWANRDIGNVGTQTGSAYITTPMNDTQSMRILAGGPTGIGGKADSFHFVYQPIAGDAEILGRATDIGMVDPNLTVDPDATAGLMIRDTLDADSAMVFVGPVGDGKTGGHIVVRTVKGGAAVAQPASDAPRADIKGGQWIRLVRKGSTVEIYVGTRLQILNGAGAAGTPTLTLTTKNPNPLYFGIASSSHNAMGNVWTRYEDVTIDNLAGNRTTATWSAQTTGMTGGSVLWNANNELAITGLGNAWGADPMKSRDFLQYAFFQPPTTAQGVNVSLQFLVTGQGMTSAGGRVAAMYRFPTGGDITKFARSNATVALSLTQGLGLELNVRSSDGEKYPLVTALTKAGLTAPLWLRIDRLITTEVGDPLKAQFTEIRAYYSPYSKNRPTTPGNWLPFGESVFFRDVGPVDFTTLGIAVSSYVVSTANTAQVTNISVTTEPAPPPITLDGGVAADGGGDGGGGDGGAPR